MLLCTYTRKISLQSMTKCFPINSEYMGMVFNGSALDCLLHCILLSVCNSNLIIVKTFLDLKNVILN